MIINDCRETKKDPNDRFILTWELCKYRLNKKIPSSLSFDERKKLLIQTPEWSRRINGKDRHLYEEKITEKNIQQEIDLAGIQAGIDFEMKFEVLKFKKSIQ